MFHPAHSGGRHGAESGEGENRGVSKRRPLGAIDHAKLRGERAIVTAVSDSVSFEYVTLTPRYRPSTSPISEVRECDFVGSLLTDLPQIAAAGAEMHEATALKDALVKKLIPLLECEAFPPSSLPSVSDWSLPARLLGD